MRLLKRAEGSFVGRVVKETRSLVNSGRPLHIKISLIESAISDQQECIRALERQLPEAHPARLVRLQKLLELRRRALGHYRSTAKALLAQDKRPWAAVPLNLLDGPGREGQPTLDPPFMEFSS